MAHPSSALSPALSSTESDFLHALGKVFSDKKWDGVAEQFSISYRFDETLSKLREGERMTLSIRPHNDRPVGITVELRRVPYRKLEKAQACHYCGRPPRVNGMWTPTCD
jgi:hypothetical protein